MHRAYTSVVLVLGLLAGACASSGPRAALGWSLGGEAHVFVADDRFAGAFYRELNGRGDLRDALEGRSLVAVDAGTTRSATVLSARGAALARVTLARFHAPQTCGYAGVVTEVVLAFPPSVAGGRSAPSSHMSVVALFDQAFAGGPTTSRPMLSTGAAMALIRRVADRAENATRGARLGLLHAPTLNADQAADAGEVVPLGADYAVGFRASFVGGGAGDTTLITGVAVADTALHRLRWVVRPQRLRLVHGMIRRTNSGVRYSLRGAVTGHRGSRLLLVDEFADVSPRESRATAVDVETRRVVAAQPLALRCP